MSNNVCWNCQATFCSAVSGSTRGWHQKKSTFLSIPYHSHTTRLSLPVLQVCVSRIISHDWLLQSSPGQRLGTVSVHFSGDTQRGMGGVFSAYLTLPRGCIFHCMPQECLSTHQQTSSHPEHFLYLLSHQHAISRRALMKAP